MLIKVYIRVKFEKIINNSFPTMDLNVEAKPNCWRKQTANRTSPFHKRVLLLAWPKKKKIKYTNHKMFHYNMVVNIFASQGSDLFLSSSPWRIQLCLLPYNDATRGGRIQSDCRIPNLLGCVGIVDDLSNCLLTAGKTLREKWVN